MNVAALVGFEPTVIESKGDCLRPLGDRAISLTYLSGRVECGSLGRVRTYASGSQSPMPYQLGYKAIIFLYLLTNANMADLVGLEPTTPHLTGECSDQLSYRSGFKKRKQQKRRLLGALGFMSWRPSSSTFRYLDQILMTERPTRTTMRLRFCSCCCCWRWLRLVFMMFRLASLLNDARGTREIYHSCPGGRLRDPRGLLILPRGDG